MTAGLGSAMPRSRTEAIQLAQTYLQGGLVAHDADAPALAPECFRHENGWATGDETVIRRHFPKMTMCRAVRNQRWLVELPYVAVTYELRLDEHRGGSKPVAEFFTVGDDGISEVAAVFPLRRWMDNAVGPGSARERSPRSQPARGGTEALTQVLADLFVEALANDGAAPFGEDVTVMVNGEPPVCGAAAAASLLRGLWPAPVSEARRQLWVIEGYETIGRLEFVLTGGDIVACAVYLRRYGDKVREVELLWGPGPSPELVRQWRAATA